MQPSSLPQWLNGMKGSQANVYVWFQFNQGIIHASDSERFISSEGFNKTLYALEAVPVVSCET